MCLVEYHTSIRDTRVCRVCGEQIRAKEAALRFSQLPAGGSWVSYHFHAACLDTALARAQHNRDLA